MENGVADTSREGRGTLNGPLLPPGAWAFPVPQGKGRKE